MGFILWLMCIFDMKLPKKFDSVYVLHTCTYQYEIGYTDLS